MTGAHIREPMNRSMSAKESLATSARDPAAWDGSGSDPRYSRRECHSYQPNTNRHQEPRLFAPGTADLARVHFSLREVERCPGKARSLIPDPESWLARQWELFHRAEVLAALCEPDLSLIAQHCGEGNRDAEQRLIRLLDAEAHCANALPVSPARTLAIRSCGRAARIAAVLPTLTAQARLLARLVLARHGGEGMVPVNRDSYDWRQLELASQLPWAQVSRPDLIAAFVGAGADAATSLRWVAAVSSDSSTVIEWLVGSGSTSPVHPGPFSLDATMAKRFLLAGVAPERVVGTAERVAEVSVAAQRLLDYRHLLPAYRRTSRQEWAQHYRLKRRKMFEALREIVSRLSSLCAAEVLESLIAYLTNCPAVFTDFESETAFWIQPLTDGVSLNCDRWPAFMAALVASAPTIWDASKPDGPISTQPIKYARWFCDNWKRAGLVAIVERVIDPDLIPTLLRYGCARAESLPRSADPASFRLLAEILSQLDPGYRHSIPHVVAVVDTLGCTPLGGAIIKLLRFVADLSSDNKDDRMSHMLHLIAGWKFPEAKRMLTRDKLLKALTAHCLSPEAGPVLEALIETLVALVSADASAACMNSAARVLFDDHGRRREYLWLAPKAALFAAAVCSHGANFHGVFECLFLRAQDDGFGAAMPVIQRSPALAHAIGLTFPREPRRCLALLTRIVRVVALGPETVEIFQFGLRLMPEPGGCRESVPLRIARDATVYRLLRRVPDLSTEVIVLSMACNMVSDGIPKVLQRLVNTEARMMAEIRHLEAVAGDPIHPRAAKLWRQIESGDAVRKARSAIADRLPRLAASAVLEVAERQLGEALRVRLDMLAGPVPPTFTDSEKLYSAIYLMGQISRNRKVLLALVRSIVEGAVRWVPEHPQNVAFLRDLAERGIDTALWLASNARNFPCAGVSGGRVTIAVENDPIEILLMGSHFFTCLSIDDFNAFSVVANAVELNKRVIYARDATGRVVGRKLIGLNEDGELLGYCNYAATSDDAGHATLQALLNRFARELASACGLTLTQTGTVPTLFCESWYDDGAVEWGATDHASEITRR